LKTLLQLAAVSKSFGAVRALRNVSLELLPGEVHALLGENGAGKSTLIKIITGAHAPDSGRLEIQGLPVRHFSPVTAQSLGIACVYQQPALFPDLTVAENIALRLEPVSAWRRVRWKSRRDQATSLLRRLGSDLSPDAEVRTLSMPAQQLVEIACALGAGARIVIMDEPTASLTHREQERLQGIVRELRADGVGVIYITHRLEEVFALADRVTVLRDGESVGTRRVHPLPRQRGVSGSFAAVVGDPPVEDESELIRLMVGREVSQLYPSAGGTPGRVVLSLRGLSCAECGVRNITLEVRAGEVVGLAGLMGAGRTELAGVLFGLTAADAGQILMDGTPVTIRSPQEAASLGIAYVPEDRRRHGVIQEMAIAHNMTLAIHGRLFPGTWLRLGAERELALEFMRELAVKATGPDSPAGTLSGGNQQKVALARWLATRPRLLILDEPTQGVDVGAKSEIHRLIRRLADQGMAVLMISSDLPEILGMSDRIGVLRGGALQAMLPRNSEARTVMSAALGMSGAGEVAA